MEAAEAEAVVVAVTVAVAAMPPPLALVRSWSSRFGGRELALGVAAPLASLALVKNIGCNSIGFVKASAAADGHGATLRLVSLEGLGLEAVRDKQAGGGCRGWGSERSRPMLQAS